MQLSDINKKALLTIGCCQFVGLAVLDLSSRITLTFICPTVQNENSKASSLCLRLRRALEGSAIRGINACEAFVSLTLTTFLSSSKKRYQNLNAICPCACGLRSKALQWVSMLLSRGVRAIISTPEFPGPKSERKHSMCFWSGRATGIKHTDLSVMSLELALWIHTS